jgi:hypothetical protein
MAKFYPQMDVGVHRCELLPRAEKIVLVMDNLNTPKPASLYAAFAPQGQPVDQQVGDPPHAQARQWLNISFGKRRMRGCQS